MTPSIAISAIASSCLYTLCPIFKLNYVFPDTLIGSFFADNISFLTVGSSLSPQSELLTVLYKFVFNIVNVAPVPTSNLTFFSHI